MQRTLICAQALCDRSESAQAVAFATEAQAKLTEAHWPRTVLKMPQCKEVHAEHEEVVFRGPRVRMGVHWAAEGTVAHRSALLPLIFGSARSEWHSCWGAQHKHSTTSLEGFQACRAKHVKLVPKGPCMIACTKSGSLMSMMKSYSAR